MYAAMGVTGRVGGVVAETLLKRGHQVRAIVRNAAKGVPWRDRGAEIAIAASGDSPALSRALSGAEGVFVMVPPNFAPSKGFPETRAIVSSIRAALVAAHTPKVVVLSSIGAQHEKGIGLITASNIIEKELAEIGEARVFLRAGWFMENHAGDVETARQAGHIRSFLQPLDRAVPMVATRDIGIEAAGLLVENWSGTRVVELESAKRVSPLDIARALGRALGRDVRAELVPREMWEQTFRESGAEWPEPRIEMIDGFNSGWIDFEGTPRKGRLAIDDVVAGMVARHG